MVTPQFILLSFFLESIVSLLTWSVRDLGAGLDDKLGAEVVKSRGLEKELSEVKDTLVTPLVLRAYLAPRFRPKRIYQNDFLGF